jgi:hypothetical protein
MPGSLHDINVLHRSLVFDWLLKGTAVNYEINDNAYNKPYYLAMIYLDWTTLVKTVRKPNTEKTKVCPEACRKNVKRALGVLQARWAIVLHRARTWSLKTMHKVMTCCVIMPGSIIGSCEGRRHRSRE